MRALAGNVWRFLHRFTLGAAILSGGHIARTDRMGAFFNISHLGLLFVKPKQ
jgi:hypothetical protein